jgi:hypothetical protein
LAFYIPANKNGLKPEGEDAAVFAVNINVFTVFALRSCISIVVFEIFSVDILVNGIT